WSESESLQAFANGVQRFRHQHHEETDDAEPVAEEPARFRHALAQTPQIPAGNHDDRDQGEDQFPGTPPHKNLATDGKTKDIATDQHGQNTDKTRIKTKKRPSISALPIYCPVSSLRL